MELTINRLWIGLVALFFVLPAVVLAQPARVSFEELASRQQEEARRSIIFLQTDWCKYCKWMESTTLMDEEVIEVLNRDFYFVPFDAESEKDIQYKNEVFSFRPEGGGKGTHELAAALGSINGKLTYPTIVVLTAQDEIEFQHAGALSTEDFLRTLRAAQH